MSTHVVTGRWTVKRGGDDEFVSVWEAAVLRAELEAPGTSAARLLQSTDDPSRFLGLWEFRSADAIAAWQADTGAQELIAALERLVEPGETEVFEVKVVVG
jgi:heme-degrading monooxygenase HmoA